MEPGLPGHSWELRAGSVPSLASLGGGTSVLAEPRAPTAASRGHSSREPDRGCVSLRVPWLSIRVSPPPSELGWLQRHRPHSQSGVDWVAAL